jgi:hypothetical protein
MNYRNFADFRSSDSVVVAVGFDCHTPQNLALDRGFGSVYILYG